METMRHMRRIVSNPYAVAYFYTFLLCYFVAGCDDAPAQDTAPGRQTETITAPQAAGHVRSNPTLAESETKSDDSSSAKGTGTDHKAELPPPPTEQDRPLPERWLSALAKGEVGKLASLCVTPFRLRSTNKPHRCDSYAKTPERIRSVSACLVEKEPLFSDTSKLALLDGIDGLSVACAKLSPKLRRMVRSQRDSECFVAVGDGVSFEMAFQLRTENEEQKIAGVWYERSYFK